MDFMAPIICLPLASYIIYSAYKTDKAENKYRTLEISLGLVIVGLTLAGLLSRLGIY